jgi:FPC/CPF motif-containing protein YcgG
VFDDPKRVAGDEAQTIAATSSDVSTSGSVDEIAYDPEDNATLERFSTIKQGANCPFAKAAKLWGGPDAGENAGLEDQARNIAPQLALFVGKINEGERLDGFCIELVDPSARNGGPKELGEAVRKMLASLSELDPSNENMMQVDFVGSRGWRFRYAGEDFFVTSFSPAYPSTSSRYAFGSPHAFLLLQPETSFARHKLPDDTADTNWEAPKTIRDKTRVAYKEAGRSYHIPVTIEYPPAEHIVKPMNDDGRSESVVRWWIKPMRT